MDIVRLELPTIRWTINEGNLLSRKKQKAFLPDQEVLDFFDRNLLTHPIPKYVHDMFGKKALKPNGTTVIFKRFPNLLRPEELYDILVQAFLGFPQPKEYSYGYPLAILNDSWTVNLHSTDKENVMMDSFLRGFGEDLKNKWTEGKEMKSIDISDELIDLHKVYTDAEEHLKKQEEQALETLRQCMKRYLEKQEERKKISNKFNSLKQKIEDGKKPPYDNEDEEE